MHIHKWTRKRKIILEKPIKMKFGAVTKDMTIVVGARKCRTCGKCCQFDAKVV